MNDLRCVDYSRRINKYIDIWEIKKGGDLLDRIRRVEKYIMIIIDLERELKSF